MGSIFKVKFVRNEPPHFWEGGSVGDSMWVSPRGQGYPFKCKITNVSSNSQASKIFTLEPWNDDEFEDITVGVSVHCANITDDNSKSFDGEVVSV